MTGRWLSDAPLEGRRVFLRADLNVPVENGRVADDTRLTAVLPTIRTILGRGASIVLASHLGRPDGRVVPGMSLAPVAERLSQLLGSKVLMAPDSIGRRVETMASGLKPGDVLLLENLRFHPGEEEGDPGFARSLAALADLYVNDAFGTCHRTHASMTGVPAALGGGYAGLLVQKELDFFSRAVDEPARPFTLLLGGAKVSDKVPVIEHLIEKVDSILIGGGMAFTFLRASGLDVGRSLLEEDMVAKASSLVDMARVAGVTLLLPVDVVAAPGPGAGMSAVTVPVDSIPHDMAGLDIGPLSSRLFADTVRRSRTVVWNGPMGYFEKKPFDRATREMAEALAQATAAGAVTIVGGGDSARAVSEAGYEDKVSFVSTGGGVSLELLQGRELVALKALGGA